MNTRLSTIAVLGFATLLGADASAQVIEQMSLDSSGVQGNSNSYGASASADGRVVAYESNANNLVPGDTNAMRDIFARDRQSGTTLRVSVASDGTQANGKSFHAVISADARFVAFHSEASNLVTDDANGFHDVFVRDLERGTTERVSVDSDESEANQSSYEPSISADGRYVAFRCFAPLVPEDTNGTDDIYVRDRQIGTTGRVSIGSGGAQGDLAAFTPSISADGRFVAFRSLATNLVLGDTNGKADVFVHDRLTGTTERVSVDSTGAQADGASEQPAVSADGRWVAFTSEATNLVLGDTNGRKDIYVADRVTGATERISVTSGGAQGEFNCENPTITADGRHVVFWTTSSALASPPGGFLKVLLHDRDDGSIEVLSLAPGTGALLVDSYWPRITPDGRHVAFTSRADVFPGETPQGHDDAFLLDRHPTSLTSLCDPGTEGVIDCPCSNAPAGSGRGCDNSAASGGAVLSSFGHPYLGNDDLHFRASGEPATATSILLQGTSVIAAGVPFGQGVRCVGGSLSRLYLDNASGGSVIVPNPGDPSVSERSAALGDPIAPGQSRWYVMYYRDPVVLGGCPSSSTFNATQTGRITWWP